MKRWPLDHWLVGAQVLPLLTGPVYWAIGLFVWLGNLGPGQGNAQDLFLVGGATFAIVLIAWSPVLVGAWLYARKGAARPWLLYGPLPTTLAVTFIFALSPPLWPVLAILWALAAGAIAAGVRYGKADAMPPLPPTP